MKHLRSAIIFMMLLAASPDGALFAVVLNPTEGAWNGIKIDGDFSDWSKLSSDRLAEASKSENSVYDALYNIKFCTDRNYIYFYLEFDADVNEKGESDGEYHTVNAVEIFMNVDNDSTTGFNALSHWSNAAADYLVEGIFGDMNNAGLYRYTSENQDGWEWEDMGNVQGIVTACNPITVSNAQYTQTALKAMEGKISRAAIPSTIKTLQVGVWTLHSEWETSGLLPEETASATGGQQIPSPMLDVPLFDDVFIEEPAVTVLGVEIPTDSTGVIDLNGDGTMVYDSEDNTLTLSNLTLEVGDEESTAISYSGTEPLTIVLNDSSTIIADTVIASQSDIIIIGDGHLVAEGVVPIIGSPEANIRFESVNMHVRSLPSPAAVRRRISGGKRLDETGGPALSGFGSADFNKTNVSPSDAAYGPVTTADGNGNQSTTNALYTTNESGEQEVLTEFELTAADENAVEIVRTGRTINPMLPMYNILGQPVNADYKGLVIQNGQTYLLR